MAEIAILGYGTVGSGVMEVLEKNRLSIDKKAQQPIRVKHVLDIRSFPGHPVEKILTRDFNDILCDNDVSVVVETMGGVDPAYGFVKKCLLRGKTVVTSNKDLVAKHGAELLAIARENNLNFLFEASVGGGIPLIRPLNQSLTADEIQEIKGILNGTTNYILTKMTEENMDFDDALAEAQANGYAEADPSSDVDGYDACRKLAIMLSLAVSRHVNYEDIHTEGIRRVSKADINYARRLGGFIKLLAAAKIDKGRVFARVSPVIIPGAHPLSIVNGVFNAVFVKCNVMDEVMFYGRGAGKFPTASAVVADVIDAVKHYNRNIIHFWSSEKMEMEPIDGVRSSKLVRVAYDGREAAMQAVEGLFGAVKTVELEDGSSQINEFAFITPVETERALNDKIDLLKACGCVRSIPNTIRLEGGHSQ